MNRLNLKYSSKESPEKFITSMSTKEGYKSRHSTSKRGRN